MSAQHTQGRLAIDRDTRPGMEWNNHIVCESKPNKAICFMAHSGEPDNSEYEANARRLVACWNALEDLPQAELDGGWTRAGLEAYAKRMEAQRDKLLAALEAYRTARAMPSYGDYAAIPWESKAGPTNPTWGGGDCKKHGRWYGRCHSCSDDFDKLCKQADRDAVRARDNALHASDELARTAIAEVKGGEA